MVVGGGEGEGGGRRRGGEGRLLWGGVVVVWLDWSRGVGGGGGHPPRPERLPTTFLRTLASLQEPARNNSKDRKLVTQLPTAQVRFCMSRRTANDTADSKSTATSSRRNLSG